MTITVLPHLAERIINTPLLITEEKLSEILYAIGNRVGITPEQIEGLPAQAVIPSPDSTTTSRPCFTATTYYTTPTGGASVQIEGGVGILPIQGTLIYRSTGIDAFSGLTSYTTIKSNFQSMLNNSKVSAILLDVDSPGGEVSALFDLVDLIYNARGKKPIIAVANVNALSAAYAIASASDEIYLSRTSLIGSIGVIALHVDRSQKNEKEGVKYTAIYAGSKKNDLTPNEPLSNSARATAQERVGKVYNLFLTTVARNTGLSITNLKSQEAAIYMGEEAIGKGLANGVRTFDEVFQIAKTKGEEKVTNEELQTKSDAQQIEIQELKAKGEKSQTKLQEMETQGIEVGKRASLSERTRVTEITSLCAVMEVPKLTELCITKGYSVEEAKTIIQEAKARQSEIDSILTPNQNLDTSKALVKDAEERLKAAGQIGPLV